MLEEEEDSILIMVDLDMEDIKRGMVKGGSTKYKMGNTFS